jgi:hypothetical protein
LLTHANTFFLYFITAALDTAKKNAVKTATHHGAKAKTVTGNAIVAVHKYRIKIV